MLLLDTSSGRPALACFRTPARIFEHTCSPFRALFQTPFQTPARLFRDPNPSYAHLGSLRYNNLDDDAKRALTDAKRSAALELLLE